MTRLSITAIITALICLSGCGSTPAEKTAEVYANFYDCQTFDYKPLQIKQTNSDHSQNIGSAFYIGDYFNKHIFVTNAHILQKDGPATSYHSEARIYDQNGKHIRVKVVATREVRAVRGQGPHKDTFLAQRIADLAILEAEALPDDFDVQIAKLPSNQTVTAFADGVDYKNQRWNGCFDYAYQNTTPLMLGGKRRAVQSFSGTPAFDKDGVIIGVITASGHVVRNQKKVPLFVYKDTDDFTVITSKQTADSQILFAILTPVHEVISFLNETYQTHIFWYRNKKAPSCGCFFYNRHLQRHHLFMAIIASFMNHKRIVMAVHHHIVARFKFIL